MANEVEVKVDIKLSEAAELVVEFCSQITAWRAFADEVCKIHNIDCSVQWPEHVAKELREKHAKEQKIQSMLMKEADALKRIATMTHDTIDYHWGPGSPSSITIPALPVNKITGAIDDWVKIQRSIDEYLARELDTNMEKRNNE